jgi:hypothetical protein
MDSESLAAIDRERSAQRQILEALRTIDVDVVDLDDLMEQRELRARAEPVLIEHLSLETDYSDLTRSSVANALIPASTRRNWGVIKKMYRDLDQRAWSMTKDALADALARAATADHEDEVAELVADRRLGPSRIMLLPALRRLGTPAALGLLEASGDDPDLQEEAKHQLRLARRRRD